MAETTNPALLPQEFKRRPARGAPEEGSLAYSEPTVSAQVGRPNQTTPAEAAHAISSQTVLDILKMTLTGASLNDVLMSVAHLIEAQGEGMLCSILLLDKDGAHLRYGPPEAFQIPTSWRPMV